MDITLGKYFVKIDRTKLNILLRSGLKSEIKTRKQLAAQLGLDPTSLTRWFANRDRLGNPRYPIVPDRHVGNILQIFDVEADSLNLDDTKFRQYCFTIALERNNHSNDGAQKALLRLESIARRKLTIKINDTQNNNNRYFILATVLVVMGVAWWVYVNKFNQNESQHGDSVAAESSCWAGYSESLGSFTQEDTADPCHYGKLFYNALEQLKANNNDDVSVKVIQINNAEDDYILFLANKLQQRRVDQEISLNIEFGRRALKQLNYVEALAYFQTAETALATSPMQRPKFLSSLSAYIRTAVAANKSNQKSHP